MIESICGGVMYAKCPDCGARFTIPEPNAGSMHDVGISLAQNLRCDNCGERFLQRMRDEEAAKRRAALVDTLEDRLRDMGVPEKFIGLDKAPNRALAEWVWQRKEKNLLLGGHTGSGKTTAVLAAIRCMAKAGALRARYCQLSEVAAEYVQALKGNEETLERFWWRLGRLDVLAVDEMVGRGGYGKWAPSTQEFISGLVDRAYSKSMRGAVWLVGNFHLGSIHEAMDDAQAIQRRLRECFSVAWVEEGKVKEVEVANV